ncbi:MAG: hypothetical protein ACO1SV_20735 [Fimbriimonas sp.]
MMTEFEVRCRVTAIRNAEISPLQKARLLLKIGRSLSTQAENLRRTTHHVGLTSDRNTAAGLTRMAMQARHLRQDVRDEAWSMLRGGPQRTYLS